jgi:hypothetical protein
MSWGWDGQQGTALEVGAARREADPRGQSRWGRGLGKRHCLARPLRYQCDRQQNCLDTYKPVCTAVGGARIVCTAVAARRPSLATVATKTTSDIRQKSESSFEASGPVVAESVRRVGETRNRFEIYSPLLWAQGPNSWPACDPMAHGFFVWLWLQDTVVQTGMGARGGGDALS